MWDLAAVKLSGGPGGPPRHVVSRVQTDRLFRAVAEVAAEHGIAGISVRLVLERARVSRITFYELFDDLDDCVLTAYREAIDAVLERAAGACATEDARERITRGTRDVLSLCREEPAVAKLLLAAPSGTPELARARAAATERLEALLVAPLRELGFAGDSGAVVSAALVGGAQEAVAQLLADDSGALAEAADEIVALFIGRV